ncbi:LysR family transcriptional regulator [Herbaspirillum frisingense]|uniref:LysR family transcriptional regulator n=1 Tax=Herbaspirillum frisingense TaxID=92645 RepID=UPI0015FEE44E|nr:LysR family transcriptional regulator [Herbaspirillum frisingense]QNB06707.1 LysR family transcriptional regulator [Herbaspirillum frisingense]
MNQLLSIRCFARVVETRSFTRAAETLDLPKSTVSKLIVDLENHLGVRLLQRTTRRIEITADGQAYYAGTAGLIRDLEHFDQSFSSSHVRPRGKIRVDIGGTPGRLILLPKLPEFFARYPDVQIELGITDRPLNLIEDHVDVVIRGGILTEQSAAARPLGSASWTTCASPAYLARHGLPRHPDDLRQGHVIVGHHSARTNRSLPARFEQGAEVIEIDGPCYLSVNDGGSRGIAALGGLGVVQTLSFTIKDALTQGTLIEVLPDWRPTPYPFHVMYPENRKLSNRVRIFIDWVAEVFKDAL